MGKINLTALQVRKRALAELQSQRLKVAPVWLDVMNEVPPAQILTRNQPQQHSEVQVRTKSLPNGRTEQVAIPAPKRKTKSGKSSRLFAPVKIRYEEDKLRKQFFQDHPWELARPRIVVETTGNQHKDSDFAKGLEQPLLPLSGESVVQRQLHLLHTVPDITTEQAYDVARREFYSLRRQEATKLRIAKEEMLHMGATPEKGVLQWGMQIENKHYNDWEVWARGQVSEQIQRSAAFSGELAPAPEQQILGAGNPGSTRGPFGTQQQLSSRVNRGEI